MWLGTNLSQKRLTFQEHHDPFFHHALNVRFLIVHRSRCTQPRYLGAICIGEVKQGKNQALVIQGEAKCGFVMTGHRFEFVGCNEVKWDWFHYRYAALSPTVPVVTMIDETVYYTRLPGDSQCNELFVNRAARTASDRRHYGSGIKFRIHIHIFPFNRWLVKNWGETNFKY